jgi:hypothetical protein
MTMAYEGYRKRMNAQKAIVKIARNLVNRMFSYLNASGNMCPVLWVNIQSYQINNFSTGETTIIFCSSHLTG